MQQTATKSNPVQILGYRANLDNGDYIKLCEEWYGSTMNYTIAAEFTINGITRRYDWEFFEDFDKAVQQFEDSAEVAECNWHVISDYIKR